MGSLPHIVDELPGVLQLFSDGSVHRPQIDFTKLPPSLSYSDDDAKFTTAVTFKDIIYQNTLKLSLRLFKPHQPSNTAAASLPVVIFFHGGGFCVGSCTWPTFHTCCLKLAADLQAIVISPDYRLAPEHRLPAALDDAVSALEWLRDQAEMDRREREELLCGGVDFCNVFVVGDSSGGTMVHHLAVKIGSGFVDSGRVRVKGFVLMGPFFGGVVRTRSEAHGPCEELLSLEILDKFWRLALPLGATRDHQFANPFGPGSLDLAQVDLQAFLIIVGGAEVMRDRIEDYATRLKELGKDVEFVVFEGMQHGFFTNEPHSEIGAEVLQVIKQFMKRIATN
ncbi:hypothetical protein QQ045_004166 [Rhodiola kirilowii]